MDTTVLIIILSVVLMIFISSSVGLYFGYEKYIVIPEGQAISCAKDSPVKDGIFRFTNGEIKLYPTPAIADSWDENWKDAISIMCKDIKKGPNMILKS